jgi:hypothetical protein
MSAVIISAGALFVLSLLSVGLFKMLSERKKRINHLQKRYQIHAGKISDYRAWILDELKLLNNYVLTVPELRSLNFSNIFESDEIHLLTFNDFLINLLNSSFFNNEGQKFLACLQDALIFHINLEVKLEESHKISHGFIEELKALEVQIEERLTRISKNPINPAPQNH